MHRPWVNVRLKHSVKPATKKDNLTAVLYGINDLRLEQRPIPVPNDHQVLLRMEVVGICGSDVHFLVKGHIGNFIVKKPMVMGHEASGTVIEVGKKVENLKVGDRVAIEPGECCRMCTFCKTGRYNLCPKMVFCATPPNDGNLTRFYVHAADFCFKLPEHVSLEEGTLLEPLAVGVRGCKRGEVGVDSVVLIIGSGPIGLTTLLSAKAYGASRVIVTDKSEMRLETAKCLGADYTVLVDEDDDDKSLVEKILCTANCEPTVTIDCVCIEQTLRVGIQATKPGGSLVVVGMAADEAKIPISSALVREVDIKGVFRYVNDYGTALGLVSSGKVDAKPLVTHRFKIEETIEAFETARTGKGDPIKILIHVNPQECAG